MNDPCPSGWKVPSFSDLQNLMVANNDARVWTGNGYKMGNNLYLPAAGYRNAYNVGTLTDVSIEGRYCSSSIYMSDYYNMCAIYFTSSGFSSMYGDPGGSGNSVRCIAE
jgi:hypothetical protein